MHIVMSMPKSNKKGACKKCVAEFYSLALQEVAVFFAKDGIEHMTQGFIKQVEDNRPGFTVNRRLVEDVGPKLD
ncbi:unnamed protein product [Clavelina lepadiformis]|uniref:Uncharacterized protein n=1 Tax=Clavelina lepadiformis TaxID=159417 RepID=A0ABP0FE07_CLALP